MNVTAPAPAAAAELPVPRTARWAVNAAFLVCGLVYGSWAARIPRIQSDRGISEATLGQVLLCTAVGALVAMPFAGAWIARAGSRRVTALTFVLMPLVAVAMTTSTSVLATAAGFFALGVVNGSLDVAMNAQAVAVEEAYRRPIMSSFHAVFSAGMLGGALLGSGAAAIEMEVTTQMMIAAGLGLAVATWAIPRLYDDSAAAGADGGGHGLRLPVRALWVLGAIAFCGMLGEGAMADWSVKYLKDVVGAPVARAALGLAAFSVAMTVGRVFGDRVRAAWGDRRLLRRASVAACAGLALTLAFPHPVASLVGIAGVGLALATVVPIAFSTAAKVPGLGPGVGISMVSTIGYSGFLFGPAMIGFLAEEVGLRGGLGFVLGLFGVMVGLTALGPPLGPPGRER